MSYAAVHPMICFPDIRAFCRATILHNHALCPVVTESVELVTLRDSIVVRRPDHLRVACITHSMLVIPWQGTSILKRHPRAPQLVRVVYSMELPGETTARLAILWQSMATAREINLVALTHHEKQSS